MPRIRPRVFYQARSVNLLLPRLLPTCRDLASARNELRWLQEHATRISGLLNHRIRQHDLLGNFVQRRSVGEPLQYILESEFFGDLEIKCRRDVLIPRPETAISVSYLVHRLCNPEFHLSSITSSRTLRVLDLCTGTGCIPLLFHHEFYQHSATENIALELVGVDISTQALSLARENLIHQIARQASSAKLESRRAKSLRGMGFVYADVLDDKIDPSEDKPNTVTRALQRLKSDAGDPEYDILIANPPYISPEAFKYTTAPSVRKYEPKLALVPSRPSSELDSDVADFFYPSLFRIAEQVNAKIALFEVADIDQAKRVAQMASQRGIWNTVEIWRDEPAVITNGVEQFKLGDKAVRVAGSGEGRSVFVSRNGVGSF